MFAAAGRTNTSVYTLDPRGLATSEFDISDRVGYETDRRTLNESMDTLRTIAGETDGRAIVNRNEPMPELKQMVKDNSSYYLLGYNSTSGFRDGKFHEIEVKVNDPRRSAGAMYGARRSAGPIASTFHGASIASTLWLNRRLRTGFLICPFSIHHSPSRVNPVRTSVRGSTRRTYQNREINRPRCMPLISSSIDTGGCALSRM